VLRVSFPLNITSDLFDDVVAVAYGRRNVH